jgi:hypothetical protein
LIQASKSAARVDDIESIIFLFWEGRYMWIGTEVTLIDLVHIHRRAIRQYCVAEPAFSHARHLWSGFFNDTANVSEIAMHPDGFLIVEGEYFSKTAALIEKTLPALRRNIDRLCIMRLRVLAMFLLSEFENSTCRETENSAMF